MCLLNGMICAPHVTVVIKIRNVYRSYYSASECLIRTLKDHGLIVKLFYLNGDCALTAMRKFRTLKCLRSGQMSANGLQNMSVQFNKTVSVGVKSGRVRKAIVVTSMNKLLQTYRKIPAVA